MRAVVDQLDAPPVLVGASLGGLASLVAAGEVPRVSHRALILVDIAVDIEDDGVSRIVGFMRGARDGFASLEDAGDAIAAYRGGVRPSDLRGLEKNLRRTEDGRWRWHWDPQFLDGEHVIATAKHYLADGGTQDGKDQGDAEISERELIDVHAAGYPPAIDAGVQTVMASFSGWNGVKMHGNKALLTDVLKQRMDFQGIVVGDWNAHGQVPGCSNTDCPIAYNAGLDMLMAPDSWRGLYQHTLAEVGEKLQISRERVRQIENEALQKLRRLDGDRLFAYHQEL